MEQGGDPGQKGVAKSIKALNHEEHEGHEGKEKLFLVFFVVPFFSRPFATTSQMGARAISVDNDSGPPLSVIPYMDCTGSTSQGGECPKDGYPSQVDSVQSLYGMTAVREVIPHMDCARRDLRLVIKR